MEYRQLGKSGLKVPELCFGAGTFGAANEFFKAWSETTQDEANRIVDICMDAGMNLFDTADIYSDGESEKALGKALAKHNRENLMISTKATFRLGAGPNDVGSSRYHLIQSAERSLKGLGPAHGKNSALDRDSKGQPPEYQTSRRCGAAGSGGVSLQGRRCD